MIIKLLVTVFVVFALSRVVLRFRDGSISFAGLTLWSLLWIGVESFIWWPKVSDVFAQRIGIGRGVDALVYVSIIALFYGTFRLYVKVEHIEHELTNFVRQMALEKKSRPGANDSGSSTK